MEIRQAIHKLVRREHLTQAESRLVMEQIMSGAATPAQIGAYLTALRMKGETVDEIAGAVEVMRHKAQTITVMQKAGDPPMIDTCGTGGDHVGTFNISTATALVVAACGVRVAKHGNRSISSQSGSADVLKQLGVNIDANARTVCQCIEQIGIGFLFAPNHHSAMRHALAPRQEIGIRTLFNLLGPLINPAQVRQQMIGVFDGEWLVPIAKVLQRLGSTRALVVHGEDGLDEITTTAATKIAELQLNGEILCYTVTPEQFGLPIAQQADLIGGTPELNAAILHEVLNNTPGPKRDIVALNSGAALYIAGRANTIPAGITLALAALADGRAHHKLTELIDWSHKT